MILSAYLTNNQATDHKEILRLYKANTICPSSQFSLDHKLKASLDSWSSKKHDLFRVDLVSGSGRVSGSGQGEQLSKVYSGQLVGDSAQSP